MNMSDFRSKLLINLSLKNKQYHNTSSSSITATNMNKGMIAGSSSVTEDVYTYAPTEQSSRNISPIMSLSETQLDECMTEEFGSKVYTDLVPYVCHEEFENSSVDNGTGDRRRLSTISPIIQDIDLSNINTEYTSRSHDLLHGEYRQSKTKQYEEILVENQDSLIQIEENLIETENNLEKRKEFTVENKENRPNIESKKEKDSQSDSIDINESDQGKRVEKRKRNRTPDSILKAQRNKHPMLPTCSCKKNCIEKISEEKRKDIWDQFWSLDRQRRRDFLSRNVEKKATLQVSRNGSRRHNTLLWTMENVKVCKKYFLGTLGYKNDEAVQSVLKSNHLTNNKHPKISAAPDMRGKKTPTNAFSPAYESEIKDFIMKYKPVPSHYNLKHAPNRKYLPPGVNFSLIYNKFKEHCIENGLKVCSWTHFHSVIKSLNLSTAEMPQDICTKCKHYEMEHKNRPLPCNCDLCQDLANHLENKRNSRKDLKSVEEKCKNSKGEEFVYTVDMQKVICMPLLTSKDYFFSRKLILFNESFVPPGKDKEAACVIWHEGESGRKAYNIASTYVYILRKYNRDKKHVYFFLDNCNAQNKNKTLMSALVRAVNDDKTEIEKLTLEYFEVGHTYMAADAVHAAIAKKLTSAGELYDLNDFVTTIKSSRKNLQVELLTHKDMILFDNDSKAVYPKEYNLHNLKIIEFRRGKLSMFVKNNYNGEYKEIKFLKMKIEDELKGLLKNKKNLIDGLPKEESPRGINILKKDDLMTLCKTMPRTRHEFYEKLVVSSEVVDLSEQIDSDI